MLGFRFWSGAKEYKSSRSRKMLKNAPNLAIRGLDTAENEPPKVSMKWGSQTGVAPVIPACSDQNSDQRLNMSDFARPPKSRHVREKARLGRPLGFTPGRTKNVKREKRTQENKTK